MKFTIEQGSEKINSSGGLALAGAILGKLDLDQRVNGTKIDGIKNSENFQRGMSLDPT